MSQVEQRLVNKAKRFVSEQRGLRRPETRDIFKRVLYIFPHDILVENYPRKPVVAFNPGALIEGDKLWVFPRLVFDYYKYTSSIGFLEVGVEEALEGRVEKPVRTRVIFWPKKLWEFRGCEDARIHKCGDEYLVLYTGYGYMEVSRDAKARAVQGLARLSSDLKPKERSFFTIAGKEGKIVPRSMKDSAFVTVSGDRAVMLSRPSLGELEVCWRGVADLSEPCLLEDTMEPVLAHEDWELKVGWSTNTVKISSNEYLIGWHGIFKEDYSYRNGLAVVDDQGELLAVSDYLLAPRGIVEEYGDRAFVIFGDGLVKYKDLLIWVGGIGDYAIGIFSAEFDETMEHLRWLRG